MKLLKRRSEKRDLVIPSIVINPQLEVSADGLFDVPDRRPGVFYDMRLPVKDKAGENLHKVSFDMASHNERLMQAIKPTQSDKRGTL